MTAACFTSFARGGWAPSRVSRWKRYLDVTRAFRRQSDVERALVEDGWNLEHYEKVRREMN
jgi:hypothetical protein